MASQRRASWFETTLLYPSPLCFHRSLADISTSHPLPRFIYLSKANNPLPLPKNTSSEAQKHHHQNGLGYTTSHQLLQQKEPFTQ